MYGLSEKQFHLFFNRAERQKGITGTNLLVLLERRLDNVVYRLGFTNSRAQARQFVRHRHFLVNGKRVNIPSYKVRDGDEVQIKPKSRELPMVLEAISSVERELPDYIEVRLKDMTAILTRGPKLADVPYPIHMEPNLGIEFYSR